MMIEHVHDKYDHDEHDRDEHVDHDDRYHRDDVDLPWLPPAI